MELIVVELELFLCQVEIRDEGSSQHLDVTLCVANETEKFMGCEYERSILVELLLDGVTNRFFLDWHSAQDVLEFGLIQRLLLITFLRILLILLILRYVLVLLLSVHFDHGAVQILPALLDPHQQEAPRNREPYGP